MPDPTTLPASPVEPVPSLTTYGQPSVYQLGAIAAGAFGAGSLLLLIALVGHYPPLAKVAALLLGCSSTVLAITWAILLRSSHGGVLALLGCVALQGALFYFHRHHDKLREVLDAVAILGTGLAVFVVGHVVARGMSRATRIVGLLTLAPLTLAFASEAARLPLPGHGAIYVLAFLGLCVTGWSLSFHLADTARRARDGGA